MSHSRFHHLRHPHDGRVAMNQTDHVGKVARYGQFENESLLLPAWQGETVETPPTIPSEATRRRSNIVVTN